MTNERKALRDEARKVVDQLEANALLLCQLLRTELDDLDAREDQLNHERMEVHEDETQNN